MCSTAKHEQRNWKQSQFLRFFSVEMRKNSQKQKWLRITFLSWKKCFSYRSLFFGYLSLNFIHSGRTYISLGGAKRKFQVSSSLIFRILGRFHSAPSCEKKSKKIKGPWNKILESQFFSPSISPINIYYLLNR